MRDLNVLEMCAVAGGNGTQSVVVSGKEALERMREEDAALQRFFDELLYEAELSAGGGNGGSSGESGGSPEPQTSPAIKQAEKEAAADLAKKEEAEQKIEDSKNLKIIADKIEQDRKEKERLSCTKNYGTVLTDAVVNTYNGFLEQFPILKGALPPADPRPPAFSPICPKK